MRCVVVGGEAVDPAYVGRLFSAGRPPGRLVNGYGPTETTALATCHTITHSDVERGVIPIGRPFEGRSVCIMASPTVQGKNGEEGELWIGGVAVGLGYLGAPLLTAEKFVPNPFSRDPSDRYYRTRDLCRMLPDGEIQFLGRIDDQIKVRGYRIEPAGVAAVLTRIAGVDEAVVLARTTRFGTKELVVFARGDGRASPSDSRALAGGMMPDYMVPSQISWVDSIPLKSNGKVDRDALLTAASTSTNRPGDPPAAYTETENRLLLLWRRHGPKSDLTIDTEYREWGGDSLSILGLMIDIESEFHVRLSVADLEPPLTVRSMAAI